jgi:hypothetical protein
MNKAILGHGGTVMQFVGDAVMAVFGAPVALDDHADRAVAAAAAMHAAQDAVNAGWATEGLPAFGLGIGVSTGRAAAALLGLGGAAGVHRRGRHREPERPPAAVGGGGGDGALGTDPHRPAHTGGDRHPRTGAGEGARRAGQRLQDPRPREVDDMSERSERGPSGPAAADGDVLVVRGVRKSYEAEGAPVRALRGADLTLRRGEFAAVMGPSGCGKSTLLNMVAGLDTPDEGTIVLDGESIDGKTEDDLARMRRRHIGSSSSSSTCSRA